MTKLAYYAGPIDGLTAGSSPERELRCAVCHQLANAGVWVFTPQTAYCPAAGAAFAEADGVQGVNVSAIDLADGVFVDLSTPARRVGTFMEMGYALARGKPVVAYVGAEYEGHAALSWPGLVVLNPDDTTPGEAAEALVVLMAGRAARAVPSTLEYAFDAEAAGGAAEDSFSPPSRVYRGDAGYDLPVARRTVIPPSTFVDVPLAYRLAPPPGVWLRLTGRSSTLRKYGLLANDGILDEGYRGPLYAGMWNLGHDGPVVLEAGMRVVQVIPHRVVADSLVVERRGSIAELRHGERGEKGFGSSGS